jgi:hypothetical protein
MSFNPSETFKAGEDLSAKKGYAVNFKSALSNKQEVVELADAGEDSCGCIVLGTVLNGSTVVATSGLVEKAILGDTVSAVGTKLKVDSAARYVPVTGVGVEKVVAEARGTGLENEFIKINLLREEVGETSST